MLLAANVIELSRLLRHCSTRRCQGVPGGARGSQEEPGGARGSQEEPGGARRSQGAVLLGLQRLFYQRLQRLLLGLY
jgi:hypothetical protein